MNLTSEFKRGLIAIALQSIEYGLEHKRMYIPELQNLPLIFKRHAATFVTIYRKGKLNGCIGTLRETEPLAVNVSKNAFEAAFHDRRFLSIHSMLDLKVDISILSKPMKVEFHDEQDLLSKIMVPEDGLILKYADKQATFLPSVWENLPEKKIFLNHLKVKAGLEADFWSNDMEIFKYSTEKIYSDE